MTFETGNIITTPNSDAHKKIVRLSESTATLEFYTEVGREEDTVPLTSKGKSNLHFISHEETKQWQEMKALFEKGAKSFHAERDRARRQAHRSGLSKVREFRAMRGVPLTGNLHVGRIS